MAYASVLSLKQTLHRLLHPSQNSFNNSPSREFLEYAYNHVTSLQQILKRVNDCSSDISNALEGKIRDAVHNLEDLLEFHELNHAEDFDEVKQGVKSFCEAAEKITNDCVAKIGHPPPPEEEGDDDDDDDDDQAVPSDVKNWTDPFDYDDIKYNLTERMRPNDFGFFQITGLPGSGATIAATAIFEDLKHCFECRAGVRVGPRYERKEILLTILAQINESLIINGKGDDEEIGEFLYASLKGRKYMIVIDDVRDVEIWNFLERFFPVQDNGSAVVFTTRGRRNELHRIRNSFLLYDMACRYQDSWWYLFSSGVFGAQTCPPQLEEAGKKIVENCKSLGIVVFLLKNIPTLIKIT